MEVFDKQIIVWKAISIDGHGEGQKKTDLKGNLISTSNMQINFFQ